MKKLLQHLVQLDPTAEINLKITNDGTYIITISTQGEPICEAHAESLRKAKKLCMKKHVALMILSEKHLAENEKHVEKQLEAQLGEPIPLPEGNEMFIDLEAMLGYINRQNMLREKYGEK